MLTLLIFTLSALTIDAPSLGDYFGFNGIEVIKIGDDPGPIYSADINSDGLEDVVVINNRKSRIDLLLQKKGASPSEIQEVTRANQIPEHWRFEKKSIMVSHQISALAIHDYDGDSRPDIIYASNPTDIVFLSQQSEGDFKKTRTHRLRKVSANRDAFEISNVQGDDSHELVTIIDGNINTFTLKNDAMEKPSVLATDDRIITFYISDYDGDGSKDIAGIAPDSTEPVRLWLGRSENKELAMGPELRFEMPPIREFASVSLPQEKASMMAVIERSSRRIVMYEVAEELISQNGDRNASIEIYPFLGSGNRKELIIDADENGLPDLIATNPSDSTVVVYTQQKGAGFSQGVPSPTLTGVDAIAICDIDHDGTRDLFVLSEKEGVVGRSSLEGPNIEFPKPLSFTAGNTPVSLSSVKLGDGEQVAVISKQKRTYVIDFIDDKGITDSIDLGSLSRGPDEILGFDANQDNLMDVLLLTRDKPMKMLQATSDGFTVLDGEEMGQYGLVREATGDNTAILDIDFDGKPELLIASDNLLRCVRYDMNPEDGTSPGWQVIDQINLKDGDSNLISIASSGDSILVADEKNERIVLIEQDSSKRWVESDSVFVHGYNLGPIYSGDFTGDGVDDIISIGDAGFALIQLYGSRISIREKQSWRSDNERRVQHELATGDINDDGFADMVSLDAGEQMLEIFSFTNAGRMLYAMGFKIFESKIFSGGESREWQPSQVLIKDFTNDSLNDIMLLTHDRLLLYTQ